ncbi:GntR family transcriptional regulator [Catenovulum agarivorans DS-2]|uniref:GntR family transcriptional regulator n=1 Tax=Catenovulum agarivorans DS-2 TaxID=1328313 RepID=W7QBV8_9ALTE|nr:FadR/GntR family transcriptional regulator [Catenovulum agarivorans]EWH10344.1 GntR family transcriptional regulator [Catenovulum agarivorans DS-2]
MHHLALAKIRRASNLTTELADLLRQQIKQGQYAVGSKLPSSKFIEQQAGVSRSVVREAIAQLKAEGILYSQQGVGVFVADKPTSLSFSIDAQEFKSIHEAILILELRKAVEVEMCGLAAVRRSDEQLEKIRFCFKQINLAIEQGRDGVAEDFNFHQAIAEASSNHYFVRFIDYIGAGVIPAREIITQRSAQASVDYVALIQKEHEQILRAITHKDKGGARAASKAHIENSILRHQQLISGRESA